MIDAGGRAGIGQCARSHLACRCWRTDSPHLPLPSIVVLAQVHRASPVRLAEAVCNQLRMLTVELAQLSQHGMRMSVRQSSRCICLALQAALISSRITNPPTWRRIVTASGTVSCSKQKYRVACDLHCGRSLVKLPSNIDCTQRLFPFCLSRQCFSPHYSSACICSLRCLTVRKYHALMLSQTCRRLFTN